MQNPLVTSVDGLDVQVSGLDQRGKMFRQLWRVQQGVPGQPGAARALPHTAPAAGRTAHRPAPARTAAVGLWTPSWK